MTVNKLTDRASKYVGIIATALVATVPGIEWIIEWIANRDTPSNPYSLGVVHVSLILAMLTIIIHLIQQQGDATIRGDESKIILNRNEADYYEIWEELRSSKAVEITAVSHSFNTLWFNFIKKFIQEACANPREWDRIEICLISTRHAPLSYQDVKAVYANLTRDMRKKIKLELYTNPSDTMFFTGICVNRSALWLSLREPYSAVKTNEHVREWRRSSHNSSAKMVDWFLGVASQLKATGTPDAVV